MCAVVTVISGGREIGRLLVGTRLLSSVTFCACSMTSLQRIQPLRSAPAFLSECKSFLTWLRVNAIKKRYRIPKKFRIQEIQAPCKRSLSLTSQSHKFLLSVCCCLPPSFFLSFTPFFSNFVLNFLYITFSQCLSLSVLNSDCFCLSHSSSPSLFLCLSLSHSLTHSLTLSLSLPLSLSLSLFLSLDLSCAVCVITVIRSLC